MTSLLIRLFVKDKNNTDSPAVRTNYAMLASITGIVVNILLFSGKLAVGLLAYSVAIVADAFNNMSDAGSSVVTMLGFRMSSKHADKKHPLGHGRFEYISAFIVDIIIIFVGIELFKSSVEKIITPGATAIADATLILLAVAIVVKVWLFFFYGKIAKIINSQAIKAASLDSISDVVATTLVLVSALISRYTDVHIDGWAGIIVAGFILFTGIKAAKETIDLLLGASPDKEMVAKIQKFVQKYPDVVGIHDVMIHDYGPGKQIVTFHAEVSSESDFCYIHDVIDTIERDMEKDLNCIVTIHLDPIVVNDERINQMREFILQTVKEIDPELSIHDFRMTYGGNHINVIFDLCIPVDCKIDDDILAQKVEKAIIEKNPDCHAVIKAEHPFV